MSQSNQDSQQQHLNDLIEAESSLHELCAQSYGEGEYVPTEEDWREWNQAMHDKESETYYGTGPNGRPLDILGEEVEPDEEEYEDEEMNIDPIQADTDVLRMAGYGTDEDYGYYGNDPWE